ncbi:SurA N-terminal domain-containing protein [Roseibacillus ishigakijimensis]|uniref:peptidylprolyl isomerase n=1 Tax=Roseibacillus ishigakijimensis TaxID=454146 RepID=A0A934RP65_9BACT|nr:SurA N-terminal domain-containing protein [Roseibacillus ishigakijimensis]MBK1835432.1 SurA N-terminal domain-containing protein [Roseibacillus ishigakijimensis]
MKSLLTLLLLLLLVPLGAKEFQITSIAAKVNGHAITKKEVETLLAPRREVLQTMYPRQGEIYQRRLKEFRDQILEQLINNELLLSEVQGMGAQIPDHVVEQEIARIVREDYDGKEDEFNRFLRENGLTRRSFREQQREQILVQAYRSQQFGDIPPPTEAEIRAKYEERKRAMRDRTKDSIDFQKIFLVARDRYDPNVTPERQLALADKLFLELKGGADFTALAKEHSDGAFADEGGFWRDTPRTDLSLSFGDALFEESQEGDLVGPLKDPAGFTIVKILKINYGPSPPLSQEEVYERMKKEVDIEKRTERYDKWINGLKKHAMIERNM